MYVINQVYAARNAWPIGDYTFTAKGMPVPFGRRHVVRNSLS